MILSHSQAPGVRPSTSFPGDTIQPTATLHHLPLRSEHKPSACPLRPPHPVPVSSRPPVLLLSSSPTLLQPRDPYSILQTRKCLLQGLCTCASLCLKCSSFNILMAHSHSDPSLCSDISLVKPSLFILPKRQSPLLDNIFFSL